MDTFAAESALGGTGETLRGARKIAGFLSEELGEEITPDMVNYWIAKRKIRVGKFGRDNIATRTSLREDIRKGLAA